MRLFVRNVLADARPVAGRGLVPPLRGGWQRRQALMRGVRPVYSTEALDPLSRLRRHVPLRGRKRPVHALAQYSPAITQYGSAASGPRLAAGGWQL